MSDPMINQAAAKAEPQIALATQEEITIVAEVNVVTASAIVVHPEDPYLILIGDSEKHAFPVIPGGKLEQEDSESDLEIPGITCVRREVGEEVVAELLNARYIGKADDPNRDIRIVLPEKVTSAVTEPAIAELGISTAMDESARIKAHYGTPDYLFVGTVNPEDVAETEELKNPRFVDVREVEIGMLSAGHDVIALRYLEMLNAGEDRLTDGSLSDFAAASAELLKL